MRSSIVYWLKTNFAPITVIPLHIIILKNLRSGVICENISILHLIKCMERREMIIMISMNNSVKD